MVEPMKTSCDGEFNSKENNRLFSAHNAQLQDTSELPPSQLDELTTQ